MKVANEHLKSHLGKSPDAIKKAIGKASEELTHKDAKKIKALDDKVKAAVASGKLGGAQGAKIAQAVKTGNITPEAKGDLKNAVATGKLSEDDAKGVVKAADKVKAAHIKHIAGKAKEAVGWGDGSWRFQVSVGGGMSVSSAGFKSVSPCRICGAMPTCHTRACPVRSADSVLWDMCGQSPAGFPHSVLSDMHSLDRIFPFSQKQI